VRHRTLLLLEGARAGKLTIAQIRRRFVKSL
jgi:hypothetical protein